MDPPSTKDDDTMQHDDVTECQPPSDRASRENGCLPADVDLEFPTAEELDAEGIVVDGIDFSDPPVLGDDEWMPPSEFDAPSDVVVDGFHLIDGEEPCEPSPEDLLDAVRGNVVSIDEARERRAAKAPGNAGGGRSCSAPVSRPSDVDASPTEALRIANEQRLARKMAPIPDVDAERSAIIEMVQICRSLPHDPRRDLDRAVSMEAFAGHILAALANAHAGATEHADLRDGQKATPINALEYMRRPGTKRDKMIRVAYLRAQQGVIEKPKQVASGSHRRGVAAHGPRR